MQILDLVLQCINVPFRIVDIKRLCKPCVAVGGGAIYVKDERNEASAKFTNLKSGARLEVGAVGQLQLGESAAKRHERQVEVFDGGHPEERERERARVNYDDRLLHKRAATDTC